ncbi:EAL domain-containing protein [Psychromonas sp.]|uniref:EAL domain-containing protein n=1 Tax=Psychromonas sp. TaxID=1884585 RepID=UPI0035668FEF
MQLKWEHEFQFAGYYAAKWQGFYADAGLDVDIRSAITPDKSILSPSEELSKGNAQFAIGGLDILISKDKGADPVILASIFQRSPVAVFAPQQTDISDLTKLAKLRIAASGLDFTQTEITALLRSHGYDLTKINFVDQPATLDTLINDKADAIVTYDISAQFSAKERNIKLNRLHPADFGLQFYGDSLYTSYNYAQMHPDIVQKFTQASKKGWLYALAHKQEIAQRIADELPRYLVQYDNAYAYNIAFAEQIDTLINYPETPIGEVNKDRWFNMNERIRSLGLVHSHINEEHFHFTAIERQPFLTDNIFSLSIIVLFLPLIIYLWHQQHKRLTILAVLFTTFLIETRIEEILIKEEKRIKKDHAAQLLNSVSIKLQGHLQTNLSMLTGFAAYISATPDLSENDFNRYAKALLQKDPMLMSFSAARELKINYIFPLTGNEKAMGLNYRDIPEQLAMIKQVINSGQVQMIGPVNLVQGGTALIGRAPVFFEDGKLWGIISAPLDAQSLFKFSEIEESRKYINIAIRSYDALGSAGPIFFGDEAVFDSAEKLEAKIYVGGNSWHIAAVQVESNHKLPANIYLLRAFFLISTIILTWFIWFRFQQLSNQQKLELKLREDKRLLESVGRVAKIGGWKLDNNLHFLQWSEQASLALRKPGSFSPSCLADLKRYFSAEDYQLWAEKVKTAQQSSKAFTIQLQLSTKNNKPIWLQIMSDSNEVGQRDSITGTIQDITEKILSAQLIEYQASYDSLTDLPNRRYFQERLEQAIKNAHRSKQKLAVLFIDLDRFKPINDNHGHQAGDRVLIEAATRLKHMVRSSDTVARLSGDEFSIILDNISAYNHVLTLAQQIAEKMQESYQVNNIQVHLSVSIGIALYPDDADSADSLLKKADQAMYEVKASGRNGCQFYTKEMQLKSEYRHELHNKLITALNSQELQPYFQPIIDLNTNQICKCETLARWQQANGDFISPIEFIHLAEESGLINKIDLFMLEESSRYLCSINADIELSINVSPRLFHTKDNALENWVTAIKEVSKSINVTVEITERLLTDDSEKALAILNQLKSVGIKIAIDDFGIGYSSLNYLVKFPVDIIKIDRSFVNKIGIDPSSEALIETILGMANRLAIKVVAEGIETKEQLAYLQKNNCHYGQGYFLGKPMSKEDFHSLLKG